MLLSNKRVLMWAWSYRKRYCPPGAVFKQNKNAVNAYGQACSVNE